MRFIGRKKVVKPIRIGLPYSAVKEMGFNNYEYVYMYIENNDIYITIKDNEGIPVKFDSYTGRVNIPDSIRKTLGINPYDELDIYIDTDRAYIDLKKTDYTREIEVVKQLAVISKLLDTDERRELDILLDILMDEERGITNGNKNIKSK